MCRKHGVGLDRVEHPLKRSTHFLLRPNPQEYEHFLPRGGTNQVVKTFLRASAPAQLCFGTRLHRLLEREADGQICPQFDRGGGGKSCQLRVEKEGLTGCQSALAIPKQASKLRRERGGARQMHHNR